MNKAHLSETSRQTIKRRLMRSIGYTLIVAIVLVAAILSWVGNKNARKNLVDDLSVIGQIIANRSSTAMYFAEYSDKDVIDENLQSASFHNAINLICVFDGKGSLYHHYTNRPSANRCDKILEPIERLNVLIEGRVIRVQVPILYNDEYYGIVEIYSTNKDANQTFLRFVLTLASTLAIALFVAYFVGGRLVTSSLGPLTQLYSTSREIATSPYANIRAVKQSNDEIGDLVEVFNQIPR